MVISPNILDYLLASIELVRVEYVEAILKSNHGIGLEELRELKYKTFDAWASAASGWNERGITYSCGADAHERTATRVRSQDRFIVSAKLRDYLLESARLGRLEYVRAIIESGKPSLIDESICIWQVANRLESYYKTTKWIDGIGIDGQKAIFNYLRSLGTNRRHKPSHLNTYAKLLVELSVLIGMMRRGTREADLLFDRLSHTWKNLGDRYRSEVKGDILDGHC